MTTTTKTKWIEFGVCPGLCDGDQVKVRDCDSQSGTGIFKRHLRKNACVILNGMEYSVPYSAITHYRSGDDQPSGIAGDWHDDAIAAANTIAEAMQLTVDCNPAGLDNCQVGDVVLFWRGLFDVARIIQMNPLRCRTLKRNGGKVYRMQRAWFVQKLNSDRFPE